MFQLDQKFVMLVEDNPDDERLMLRALSMNGHGTNLVVARDGEQALRLLHGDGTSASEDTRIRPSLILLDLKLPKMNGVEVLKRIRGDARTASIPVVILTSSDELSDIHNCYAAGANSYVCKPVSFDEFIDAMRQLEQYWLGVNVPPLQPVLV
jgi:two-component system response regulator